LGRCEYRARVEVAFLVRRGLRRHPSGGGDEWGDGEEEAASVR